MVKLTDQEKKVLKFCSKQWFKNPAGISVIDLDREFGMSNKDAMILFEGLVEKSLGTINSNVVLYQISFSIGKKLSPSAGKKAVTHIFFPSEEVLAQHYYKSDLSKQDIPEYSKRLHLGAHQIGLVFFFEEVLGKYFNHPEKYKIEDTLAGGSLTTNWENENEEYLHVRYGKKLINAGKVAVTAIYKDLAMMSPSEQKYWSSFEVKEFVSDPGDENFHRFMLRTYKGKFVDFPNPIADLSIAIQNMNSFFENECLFRQSDNIHLHSPVENTRKDYCDSCSELYKLIGPDNIKKEFLKKWLIEKLGISESDLVNKPSEREFGTMQMFQFLEMEIMKNKDLSTMINMVKDLRIEADHKISNEINENDTYTQKFNLLCEKIVCFLKELAKGIEKLKISDSKHQVRDQYSQSYTAAQLGAITNAAYDKKPC